MSKSKTEKQTPLEVCNMAAKVGLKKAWAAYHEKNGTVPEEPETPPKLNADEKKKLMAGQIAELGGQQPEEGASVKTFEAALEAAKIASLSSQITDLNGTLPEEGAQLADFEAALELAKEEGI